MKTYKNTHRLVRKAYGEVAVNSSSCCPGSSCCGGPAVAVPKDKGLSREMGALKSSLKKTSAASEGEMGLSCGNPVAFSKIKKGMTVLDLGSGAGKDVFIAAPLVGTKGKVIGVDMTPGMLKLAQANLIKFTKRTGLANVEFRKGVIEKLPVKDAEADLIISNCVINLSPDKPEVFREAFRALKPGGFIVVSDIVLNRELPPALKKHAGLYAACVAGALQRRDYLGAIKDAGFKGIKLLSDNTYRSEGGCSDPITNKAAKALDGAASSITVYAEKSNR
jgi:SAM-dependent methyltransferase